MTEPHSPTLVIGIGNRDRGDDAAGPLVIDALRRAPVATRPATLVVEGDLSDLSLRWAADDHVVMVDAAVTGEPVGTVRRFDTIPAGETLLSSHGISLRDAIELGRLLGRSPSRLEIIAIEGACFDHFAPPHPYVLRSAETVAAQLLASAAAAT